MIGVDKYDLLKFLFRILLMEQILFRFADQDFEQISTMIKRLLFPKLIVKMLWSLKIIHSFDW